MSQFRGDYILFEMQTQHGRNNVYDTAIAMDSQVYGIASSVASKAQKFIVQIREGEHNPSEGVGVIDFNNKAAYLQTRVTNRL